MQSRVARVARPVEIVERINLCAQQVQLELLKDRPNEKIVDRLLWDIRHGSAALEGIISLSKEVKR